MDHAPRHSRLVTLAVAAAIALQGLGAAPADALTGVPPACRTSTGQVITKDIPVHHGAYSDWHRTLLDTIYTVGSRYAPADLVSVGYAGIAGYGTVRRLVLADLRALDQAARAAGIRLRVVSAYRSYWSQRSVFASWVNRVGYAKAVQYSARAGHSEHQLGTSIDFSFVGGLDPWYYVDFATTRAGAWLKANAHRFGFIMSYPKGAQQQVCYGYEPWHYRYVGRTLATQQKLSGLTPRYWLWRRQ
jgi:zinc D-Ala-D-Ala carboxypeptidase